MNSCLNPKLTVITIDQLDEWASRIRLLLKGKTHSSLSEHSLYQTTRETGQLFVKTFIYKTSEKSGCIDIWNSYGQWTIRVGDSILIDDNALIVEGFLPGGDFRRWTFVVEGN
jgi:hypothetical protein